MTKRYMSDGPGDVAAMIRTMDPLLSATPDPVVAKRRLLADLLRIVGTYVGKPAPAARDVAAIDPTLSPRMRQTLASLLAGDSEKQIALRLGLSPHTVHVYVKALYKRYRVSSRGELLARWVPKAQRAVTVLET